jgi:hypothetical protein
MAGDSKNPGARWGGHPHDGKRAGRYNGGMKSTASNPRATTERQKKDSRVNAGPGASPSQEERTTATVTSSQKATATVRRGDAIQVENKSDRSPKQENL